MHCQLKVRLTYRTHDNGSREHVSVTYLPDYAASTSCKKGLFQKVPVHFTLIVIFIAVFSGDEGSGYKFGFPGHAFNGYFDYGFGSVGRYETLPVC